MARPCLLMPFPADHPVLATPAVWHPDRRVSRAGYSVVLLRRRFVLKGALERARLWVSASQRYILYLDGQIISRGPSRSDPGRWGCVRVAVGPLGRGEHVLAAAVFHFGDHAGMGQMGGAGFFLLHGEGAAGLSALVDTGEEWRCCRDASRTPLKRHAWGRFRRYDVVGSGERIEGAKVAWGWAERGFDDASWPAARVVCRAAGNPWGNRSLGHALRPDPLPPMEERPERFARVAESPARWRGKAERWILEDRAWTVPAGSRVRLLLDRGELTNAYPRLTVSGGAGSRIRMVTAEAPLGPDGEKGNRDETAGKGVYGHLDEFRPGGGLERTFETLWFRSFRYVELTITTGERPLSLERFRPVFTGYPLRRRARFRSGGDRGGAQGRMWEISWRTARLCAHETFFDCPHYEQAQFVGDTRVQAVYHYLVAGDDRLARKAIGDFRASRVAEGLTQSRFPSRAVQVIPTFSLQWIGMLHDFRVYRGELGFLGPYLPFAREILAGFERQRRADGLLGRIGHAPFVDWTPAFPNGNAPQDARGGSSILTMLFSEACGWMAGLEKACGYPELAPRWGRLGRSLRAAALEGCWDAERGLLADTADKRSYSLHAQVQGVLAGTWPRRVAQGSLGRALADASVTQPGTLYYRYYVARALEACGLRERVFGLLESWDRLLEGTGLTTWPESDQRPRSDCHAWSVTPAIAFLEMVLGVAPDPAADGFSRVRFGPALGPLEEASGTVPTPAGSVRVRLQRDKRGGVEAEVVSPVPIMVGAGGRTLAAGRHRLHLPRRSRSWCKTRGA